MTLTTPITPLHRTRVGRSQDPKGPSIPGIIPPAATTPILANPSVTDPRADLSGRPDLAAEGPSQGDDRRPTLLAGTTNGLISGAMTATPGDDKFSAGARISARRPQVLLWSCVGLLKCRTQHV